MQIRGYFDIETLKFSPVKELKRINEDWAHVQGQRDLKTRTHMMMKARASPQTTSPDINYPFTQSRGIIESAAIKNELHLWNHCHAWDETEVQIAFMVNFFCLVHARPGNRTQDLSVASVKLFEKHSKKYILHKMKLIHLHHRQLLIDYKTVICCRQMSNLSCRY